MRLSLLCEGVRRFMKKIKIRISKQRYWMLELVSILIAIFPILTYYDFPGTTISLTSVAIIIISVCLLFIVCNLKISFKISSIKILIPYFLLLIYNMLISFVIRTVNGMGTNQVYVFVFLLLTFVEIFCIEILSKKGIFFKKILDVYIFVCISLSVISIMLELLYLITGILFPVKIPFLPLNGEYARLDYRFGYNGRGAFIGFSPFFSEPSHFAQYLLPSICLMMGRDNKKKSWFIIILIELAIIISTSSFGIAASMILILMYVFFTSIKSSNKMKNTLILFLGFAVIFLLVVWKSEIINYELKTLLTGISFGNTKSSYRIYRGFVYYLQMPLFYKFFGIGFLNFTEFIAEHNLTYIYEIVNDTIVTEYLNGISQALIYNGILGLCILGTLIWHLYKNGTKESQIMTIGLILLLLTESTYLRGNSIFYIIFIILLKNDKDFSRKGHNSHQKLPLVCK